MMNEEQMETLRQKLASAVDFHIGNILCFQDMIDEDQDFDLKELRVLQDALRFGRPIDWESKMIPDLLSWIDMMEEN